MFSRWAPMLFCLLMVPLVCASALPAPAWVEWGMAVVLAAGVWLLGRACPQARREAWVVMAAAVVIEFTFAPLFDWYDYVQWPVPPWVITGHGLVWLAARCCPLQLRAPWVISGLVLSQAAWMLAHAQLDCTGLVGMTVLIVAVARRWQTPGFVAALSLVVWWVEIWGTSLFGVWVWAPDALGLPEISPPGSAAGGYLIFLELPGLLVAAALARRFKR